MKKITVFLLTVSILSACSTSTPGHTPQPVRVYSTAAAQPWLSALYDCAGASVALTRVDEAASAEISLRVGVPERLDMPAYQIDTEEILIVTHRQSPIQNLTLAQARALFAGRSDAAVQLYVYGPGEDVQQVFDQIVMAGSRVSPSAKLAAAPQQMSDTVVNEKNAVGILPRHWKVGDVRDVYTIAGIPVLAMTNSPPQGVIAGLIACLQKQ